VAATLRVWGLDLGLPNLRARPDDEEILHMTGLVAQGHLDLDWAVYPSAWVYLCWAWGTALLHAGEWLHLLPLSGGYAEVLATAPERLLLIERALSALLGTLAVPALMALARPVLGLEASLLAGWILATNFLHVRDSHSLKPDAALSSQTCCRSTSLIVGRATARAWTATPTRSAATGPRPRICVCAPAISARCGRRT
jgi:hypothetical protein